MSSRISFYAGFIVIVAALFVLPFLFGGVHEKSYLSFALLVGVGALIIGASSLGANGDLTEPRILGRPTVVLFLLLLVWVLTVLLQILIFQFRTAPHPVLGSVTPWINLSGAFSGTIILVSFVAVFALTRWLLATFTRSATLIERLIIGAGGIVTFVALAHWFYDTGKLFGYFAPDNVFISPRARWPFVNSNSLGHFLLIPVFVTCAHLQEISAHWRGRLHLPERLDRRALKQLVLHRVSRRYAPRLVFLALLLLAMLLALLATLSRGSWLGLAVGVAVMYCLYFRVRDAEGNLRFRPRARRRSPRRTVALAETLGERIPWIFSRFVPPLVITVALLFFLAGRGLELVENRLTYSLLATKDDLRWVLYEDSWRMFLAHPLMGVGFSNWLATYSRFASPPLAGINPEYVHSDPLQLVVEMGLIGALPLLVLAAYLALHLFRLTGVEDHSRKARLLLTGLVAVITASFLDFPFRIPAIAMQVAVIMALTAHYLDRVTDAARVVTGTTGARIDTKNFRADPDGAAILTS